MYDSGKIIPGLAVFVLLITFPIWYNKLVGNVGAAPAKDPNLMPEMAQGAAFPNGQSHPPAEEMRAKHMEVLQGIHVTAKGYNAAKDGQKPTMSCLMCHGGSKEQFCDSCHAYASVKTPDCWACHTKP
ncbi:cytochrome C [Desulfobulbus sp. F4]|nr:cytochrome C [Desulfobulbus sp. F3]MCW5200678.1 cytochrome C [Desulfobulbus sp. F4]